MDPLKVILGLAGVFVPPSPSVTDLVPGGDPVQMARVEKLLKEQIMWQWKISGAVCVLILSTMCIFFFARFARASDVDAIAAEQKTLVAAINEQLAVSVADNICRLVLRRSGEIDAVERARLRRDLDELQSRYRKYTGNASDYPEQRCAVS